MAVPDWPPLETPAAARALWTQEVILAILLAGEIAVFCITGKNFASRLNAFEVLGVSVEIGLLALALTPVIVSGGIDLSVGSLMGLSAVAFGMLWRDAGWPVGLAALGTLAVGASAGGLNALLITRLRLPPLIVTLGTMSLFRGLAVALPPEGANDNFTNFPDGFLYLGQGYLLGGVPAQVPVFVAAVAGFWLLLHRTTVGRALYAIGLSPEGATYAGLPVQRRLALAYVLCGVVASLAAVIYVARLGQAKAEAGTGYELLAITAVVLGGTSIFGGRGTVHGTVLGLFAIAVLQNGLLLSDQPRELAGILVGVLLLAAIIAPQALMKLARATPQDHTMSGQGDFPMRKLLVAVCGAVLVPLLPCFVGCRGGSDQMTIAMMPKSKGNAYFIACRKGADKAAEELGVKLLWDGPTEPDPAKQNEILNTWITRGVDVIAVSVENKVGISTVLRKARQAGIKVITWDSDAETDARDFLVNQATPQGIGQTLTDQAARVLGGKGEFAIIKASLTAANMIAWEEQIRLRLKEKYPDMKLVVVRPCDDKQKEAFNETNTILNAYPNVKLIMAICSPAVPGAAEAVQQSGRQDVKVIGLGLPSENRDYVHKGITDCIVLWKTEDLGYLTVHAAYALKKGTLTQGSKALPAGRLGNVEIQGDNILLGTPFIFNKENIDRYDF